MSRLTLARAALLAGLVGVLVYANALSNGWAMDDVAIVQENARVHSLAAAWDARFSAYWPVIGADTPGQYRPLLILSFALDWAVSGGSPAWLHAVNVLLHGLATALAVLVLGAWLAPLAALAAGIVFAVHPVHVEAVANLVGRGEVLAGVALLAAVLAARRYRASRGAREAAAWFGAAVGAVGVGLFTKEHAVVAIALIACDHALLHRRAVRGSGDLYRAVAALTLAWLFLWHGVAGSFVEAHQAATLRDLSAYQRIATMLPTHLDVVRLLVLPLDLAHDYNPQVIPQRFGATWQAVLGVLTSTSILVLAVASVRRAPVVTFGVLAGIATIAPTSNLVFASGVIFAERVLYLAVLAPAALAGWAVGAGMQRGGQRQVLAVVVPLLALYAVRTVTRTPFWRDNPTVVVEGVIQHPESYRIRVQIGRAYERTGDPQRALAEYLVAGVLFDRDPILAFISAPAALAAGQPHTAVAEAERARRLWPRDPAVNDLLAAILVQTGDTTRALAAARDAVAASPANAAVAERYRDLLATTQVPAWRMHLADGRIAWRRVDLGRAALELTAAREALTAAGDAAEVCSELGDLRRAADAMAPGLVETARTIAEQNGTPCSWGGE